MKKENEWDEEIKVMWGEFIEHRPYFRQMPNGDWNALQCFVSKLLSGQQSEMLKWLPSEKEIVDVIIKHHNGNRCENPAEWEWKLAKAIHDFIKEKLEGRK